MQVGPDTPTEARSNSRADEPICWTQNGVAVEQARIPVVSTDDLRQLCVSFCSGGGRLSMLCARPCDGRMELLAVLADDAQNRLGLVRAPVPNDNAYEALSSDLPQAQAFEREIHEQWAIRPKNHPWLKPLRRHSELEQDAHGQAPAHPFFVVEGSGIHEVAVGPVHAGIIEPGHFRFQCYGEIVLHLEIQLGYQHRGAEALLLRSAPSRQLTIAESIAGDTVVGHALAHCTAIESVSFAEPSLEAHALRGIALELERLSNHVGDLGALCNDIGYLPGAAWFGRLRGEFLNLLMELSGNRFGRGLLRPGGVRFAPSPAQRSDFLRRLERAARDLKATARVMFASAWVCARFEQTGIVTSDVAERLGLVGPVGRASGCDRDVRRDHPSGIFRYAYIPVAHVESGDVMARAMVRWVETQRSLTFLTEQLTELGNGPIATELSPRRGSMLTVSMVEGWRGEIVHVAATGDDGSLAFYKIADPSLHNWFGLAMALRENQISDFPLCNKSFNLSYAGHDL